MVNYAKLIKPIFSSALLLIGCLTIALSFNLLQNPNAIAAGGVPGLATVVEAWTGWTPAYIIWTVNLVVLAAGAAVLGPGFALKSVLGSLILPLFIYLTADLPPLTSNSLLAAVYGGIGTGIGLGLVFRSGSTVGGFTIVAHLLHRRLPISLSAAVTALDFLVILAAGFAFSAEHALYAFAGLFSLKKTLQLTQEGIGQSKMAFIISERADEICSAILRVLDRGVTKLPGIGGYSDTNRTVLYVVCEAEDLMELKKLVLAIDPDAFMTISEAKEVSGEGFSRFLVDRKRSNPLLTLRKWTRS
jgi:uncharacterized membrane-anchored protein YitT (DUF2179 family)